MPSRVEVVWPLFLLGITPLVMAAMFELAKYLWARIRRAPRSRRQPCVVGHFLARSAELMPTGEIDLALQTRKELKP